MLAATAFLGAVTYGLARLLLDREGWLGHGTWRLGLGTFGVIGGASLLYLLAAHVLKIDEAVSVVRTVRRRFGGGPSASA